MKYELNDKVAQLVNASSHKLIKAHKQTFLERKWLTTNDLIFILKSSNKSLADIKPLRFYKEPLPEKPGYTPEFQKQLDEIRLRLQEEEYKQLINNNKNKFGSISDDSPAPTFADINKEIKNQVTTIFNILLSVCSVVYAIWYWTQNYNSLSTRVLMCLFFGLLVLVAEVVVFNSYLRKVDLAKKVERNKKEIKQIVETIVI